MYKKILVPLDGSELAECVLPHVESISRGCSVPEIVFLRAVEPFRMPSGGEGGFTAEDTNRIDEEARVAAENYLSQLLSRTKYDGAAVQAGSDSRKCG
jgi:nucleotide-binding universal stress UspA family protein